HEQPTPSEQVGKPSPEQKDAAEEDRVRGDHPLQALLGEVEIGADRRKRDVHDCDVEDDHELRRHDERQREPLPAILASIRGLCPNLCAHLLPPEIVDVCHDIRRQRLCATLVHVMTTPSIETPTRPLHRVAKEMVKSSGFLLARLGFGFKAKTIAAFERDGFEIYDYSVLAVLAEGVRETQATIADALTLDPSRLVALLDSLEERGLIERQRDPQDRRRHVVSITATGTRELSRLREMAKRLEDEFFAPLDPESRETLHDLLLQLAAHNDPRCAFASGVTTARKPSAA